MIALGDTQATISKNSEAVAKNVGLVHDTTTTTFVLSLVFSSVPATSERDQVFVPV
jgi:hypothetical protein